MKKILFWIDNPNLVTSFAIASKPFLENVIESGKYSVSVLASLSSGGDNDYKRKGVSVWSSSVGIDDDGKSLLKNVILSEQPDILFMSKDFSSFFNRIFSDQMGIEGIFEFLDQVGIKKPKIIAHGPIENYPVPESAMLAMNWIKEQGGISITYSEGSSKAVKVCSDEMLNPEFCHLGVDKFFKPYSQEDKSVLKRITGLEGKTVVGYVSVNRSRKSIPELLRLAAMVKEIRDDIVFYIHTNPDRPVFQGSNLRYLKRFYGADNVIFKPVDHFDNNKNPWEGNDTFGGNIVEAFKSTGYIPELAEEKMGILGSLSMVDIYNLFDVYLDLSQMEGWGLPLAEAMACSLPVIGVQDHGVRDEIFPTRLPLPVLPRSSWFTFPTGALLVHFDIEDVFRQFMAYIDDVELLQKNAKDNLLWAEKHFSWEPIVKKMRGFIDAC